MELRSGHPVGDDPEAVGDGLVLCDLLGESVPGVLDGPGKVIGLVDTDVGDAQLVPCAEVVFGDDEEREGLVEEVFGVEEPLGVVDPVSGAPTARSGASLSVWSAATSMVTCQMLTVFLSGAGR